MQRVRMLALSTTVLILGLVLSASGVSAQTAKDLMGAWTTVSVTVEQGDKKIEPFGPNPRGTQIYDASGRFATIVMRGTLPKVASNNMQTSTAEESQIIAHGSLAYYGTYTVNEVDKTVTVKIEGASFPNFAGTEQTRRFAILGDELTITNPTPAVGSAAKVVLRRAK
jgi:Lipocalin-like domain